MRMTLGGIAATVLLLFYLGVYRPTKSSFSGWWSVALLCAGLSTSLLLFNGTSLQGLSTPVSNMLAVVGATGTWFAMRSLRNRHLPLWLLALAPTVTLVATVIQSPGTNIWAGNGPMFAYMGALFAAGAVEMWLAWRTRRLVVTDEFDGHATVAYLVTAIAASLPAFFYTFRSVVYLVAGPDSDSFRTLAGTAVTTAVLLICIVAVTFSVATIGWDQQTQALRRRATQDDLTGLLGRNEFRAQAARALQASTRKGTPLTLVMADLDHFKQVNDQHGHSAGDRALLEFAAALKESLVPGDVAGRIGGEEFGLVLLGDDEAAVLARVEALSQRFAQRAARHRFTFPTASYGLTTVQAGDTVATMLVRADFALYLAKSEGRDRAVVFSVAAGHDAALEQRRHLRDA